MESRAYDHNHDGEVLFLIRCVMHVLRVPGLHVASVSNSHQ